MGMHIGLFSGRSAKNESLTSGSVWDTESNGEAPRCMRQAVLGI